MKLAATLVFLFPVVAARHHHMTLLETILKPKGNLYSDINVQIQNVANGLFDKLNIGTALHNKTRVKLLLTMHYDLKSVAEKNYDVYENMKVAAKPDNATAISQTAKKLCEIINEDEILNITEIPSVEEALQTTIETKYTELKNENMTTPIFRDSKEFDEFVKEFVEKVDKLSLKDFYEGPGLPEDTVAPRPPTFEEEDIQFWEPPDVLELDYVNDTDPRRVYQGKRTRIKTYPFMASVHIMGQFACAGTIISRDLILSAASCLQLLYNNRFYRENPRSVHVRLGSDYYAGGGEKIEVVETYFHPSYDPKTLKHNLVILRLQKLLKFMQKQRRIKRILFDRDPSHLSTNTNGILILGWGARKHSHVVAPFQRLMVAQLDIYHIDECANIYSSVYVTNHHFCAGFISTGGGACNKDVGGPGIVGGVLMGVVSFGAPVCGTVDAPTVFTKLGFYSRWIDSIIDLRTPAIGVKTTVQTRLHKEISVAQSYDWPLVKPVTIMATYRAHESTQKYGVIQDVLQDLSKLNNSELKKLLSSEVTTKIVPITTPMTTKTTTKKETTKTTTLPSTITTTTVPTTTLEETTVDETTTTIPITTIITSESEPKTTTIYSKPSLLQTTVYAIDHIPEIFYQSDEEAFTLKKQISKVDPKYYDSYEYTYETTITPKELVTIPHKNMFLRESVGITVDYKQEQADNYDVATPVDNEATTDRYEDYYEAKQHIGMEAY